MSLAIDTGADLALAPTLTAQDRADALDYALDQCRVPADAAALFNAELQRALAAARRGFGVREHHNRMLACEARRKELSAALAAADRAEPGTLDDGV